MNEVILYTQPNCGLCNDAKIQLEIAHEDVALKVEEINIQLNDALNELYCIRVPVLVDRKNKQVIQEGQIDFVTIIDYFSK
ncbi:glutaredoxin family protein [Macrococcus equi]|uniref:glutaredoxin family protein n=1 Tax=Macrococcus equi TaxID=3395462 RepID=UPI0039BDBE15